MSATTTPTCALGLTPDDLSAWRDRALDAANERRITAHAATCPACQRVIASHEALASALQGEAPPAPDPRNFARIQARIAASPAGPRAGAQLRTPRWRRAALWSGLSALAAALVISALFFTLLSQWASRRTVTTKPHATAIPAPTFAPVATLPPTTLTKGAQLTWQTYAAPAAAMPPPGNGSPDNAFAFAPSDARAAYICVALNGGGSNLFAVWATHDGAHTWKQVATLRNPAPTTQCVVTVDASDPLRVNVLIGPGQIGSSQSSASYLSADGGATWRALSAGVSLYWLVTRGQTSVAVLAQSDIQTYRPMPARAPRLVVSQNDFRTWTPIDAPLVAQGLQVWGVWQAPGDGALLVMAEKRTPNPNGGTGPLIAYSLWESGNLGASWKPLPVPANLTGDPGFIVARPRGSDPWRVCGLTYPQGNDYLGEFIACTLDGGKTWTPRPLPALRVRCDSAGDCVQLETVSGAATLLNNGTLIEAFTFGPISGGVIQDPQTMNLFALPAGSSHWENLGAIPGGTFLAVDAPGHVTLAGYAGFKFIGTTGGALDNQVQGGVNYTGEFSFATLP